MQFTINPLPTLIHKMKLKCILVFCFTSLCYFSNGFSGLGKNDSLILKVVTESNLEELIGTPWEKCGTCLCYATTLCNNITTCFGTPENCGDMISLDYWRNAGSPAIFNNMAEEAAYKSCVRNENCIVNAIKRFTNSFGIIDCNDDGNFDCRDIYYIHHNGDNCKNKISRSDNFLLSRCFNRVGIEPLPEELRPDST